MEPNIVMMSLMIIRMNQRSKNSIRSYLDNVLPRWFLKNFSVRWNVMKWKCFLYCWPFAWRYPSVIGGFLLQMVCHDDVIKWKHFPRYWPFVRGIHRSPVNSPHKGQWRGALMLSLICVWINGWVNNREAGDLRRYRAHYDVTVMWCGAKMFCILLTWTS